MTADKKPVKKLGEKFVEAVDAEKAKIEADKAKKKPSRAKAAGAKDEPIAAPPKASKVNRQAKQGKSDAKLVEDAKEANAPAPDPIGRRAVLLSPFAPEHFRIDPKKNLIGIQQELLSIPVRRPSKFKHVRVHPSLCIDVKIIQPKESGETYLVMPVMEGILARWTVPATLHLAVTSQGGHIVWPIRLPTDGDKDHPAHSTARMIARDAVDQWCAAIWSKPHNSYEKGTADVDFGEPIWNAFTKEPNALELMIEKSFRDFVIRNMSHPFVTSLGFAKPPPNEEDDKDKS